MKSIVSLILLALLLSSCGKINYSIKKNKDNFEIKVEDFYPEEEIKETDADYIPEADQIQEGVHLND